MKNIAVVCGGNSGEYDVSIQSGKVVVASLPPDRYAAFQIIIRGADWYHTDAKGNKSLINKDDFSLQLNGKTLRFDAVFNAIHGSPGEDGKLLGYFDLIGMPYTSSNMFVSALTFNKENCKRIVASHGVLVAKGLMFNRESTIDPAAVVEQLGLPVFVKPNNGGSSVGVTKVKEIGQFMDAIDKALAEDEEVLVESFLEGREFGCGVMQTKTGLLVFPVTEIISKKEFFDYEAKYTQGMADEITPADITEASDNRIKSTAALLYKRLTCKGFVRFDFIISKGRLFFLEVNTVPGISPASILPKQANAMGISLEQLFTMALENIIE